MGVERVHLKEYVIKRFIGVEAQADGLLFAQELRMYQLMAGMGVGIAFIHLPQICICKQIHCCFFQQHSSAFHKQEKHFINGPLPPGPYSFCSHRQQTAVSTACLRDGGKVTLIGK